MQRLKAYIRRTIKEAAKEYQGTRKERLEAAFRDAAYGGTASGWWNDLIYTTDVLRRAKAHRSDIAEAIADYLIEIGEGCAKIGAYSSTRVFVACSKRKLSEDDEDVLCEGLGFAIEYLTSAVASEMGVEL